MAPERAAWRALAERCKAVGIDAPVEAERSPDPAGVAGVPTDRTEAPTEPADDGADVAVLNTREVGEDDAPSAREVTEEDTPPAVFSDPTTAPVADETVCVGEGTDALGVDDVGMVGDSTEELETCGVLTDPTLIEGVPTLGRESAALDPAESPETAGRPTARVIATMSGPAGRGRRRR